MSEEAELKEALVTLKALRRADWGKLTQILSEASKHITCEKPYTFEEAREANLAIQKGTATIEDLRAYLCYLRYGAGMKTSG